MTPFSQEYTMEDEDDVLPVEGQEEEVLTQQDEGQTDDQEPIEDAGEGDQEPIEPQGHQKPTASQRIQQEIAKRKALETELAKYRDHVLETQRQARPPAPTLPVEDPEATRRRLENMGEVDRILWLQQEQDRRNAVREQHFNMQLHIQSDRLAFDRILSANPQYQRYADTVETEFNKCLQRGQPRGREELLSVAIGNEVREKAASATAKARKAGTARIQQQTTSPARARSSVASPGGKGIESPEDILRRRLEKGEYSY